MREGGQGGGRSCRGRSRFVVRQGCWSVDIAGGEVRKMFVNVLVHIILHPLDDHLQLLFITTIFVPLPYCFSMTMMLFKLP